MSDVEGYVQRLEAVGKARAEYVERMKAVRKLEGDELLQELDAIEAWAAGINSQLDDFVQNELFEANCIDTESLGMLRLRSQPDGSRDP